MHHDLAVEMAGNVLLAWAIWQVRMREIASRPTGFFDGEIKGELLYWKPEGAK